MKAMGDPQRVINHTCCWERLTDSKLKPMNLQLRGPWRTLESVCMYRLTLGIKVLGFLRTEMSRLDAEATTRVLKSNLDKQMFAGINADD